MAHSRFCVRWELRGRRNSEVRLKGEDELSRGRSESSVGTVG